MVVLVPERRVIVSQDDTPVVLPYLSKFEVLI